jgi:hypothetical protein
MSAAIVNPNEIKLVRKVAARNYVFFSIAIIGTIFDAVASYYSIAAARIADEGNWFLNQIFNFTTQTLGQSYDVGFAMTMVVRSIFGMALLVALLMTVRYARKKSERKMASGALIIVAVILSLLACYHVFGVLFLS